MRHRLIRSALIVEFLHTQALYEEAMKKDWTGISMGKDSKQIYGFEL